jgi:predicted ester cyclase
VSSGVSRAELESIATQWISLWCVPVDWKLFDRLHADAFEDCSAAGRAPTKQGFSDGLRELVRAFPDLQTRAEQLVVDTENSRVAVRWSAHGTNKESVLGIGPAQRLTRITVSRSSRSSRARSSGAGASATYPRIRPEPNPSSMTGEGFDTLQRCGLERNDGKLS